MNKYVKVDCHKNWFLVLSENDKEPYNLSSDMGERMMRSEVCALHGDNPKKDIQHRLVALATREINYENLVKKYGTILIRPSGTFMLLYGNVVIEECFDNNFPIEIFGEIVICENDRIAEHKWVDYLKKTYPNKKIVTINYFDLRSDSEVEKYFEKAELITFSTTFSNMDWFKKLNNHLSIIHKVIGYSHDMDKWEEALKINNTVEVVESL